MEERQLLAEGLGVVGGQYIELFYNPGSRRMLNMEGVGPKSEFLCFHKVWLTLT